MGSGRAVKEGFGAARGEERERVVRERRVRVEKRMMKSRYFL
jgi:hypothetical protein